MHYVLKRMEKLDTMMLADDLALSQDKILSGEQHFDADAVYKVIDGLNVLNNLMTTITIIPSKIMPTRFQSRVFKANINGVPIPPAPTKPRIDAERTETSKR